MLIGITIRNFKIIRELVELQLDSVHVLVGPNGVGKTSFLDAIDFIRDCLVQGPLAAVTCRHIADFNDLTWMRRGGVIEIELWLDLSALRPELADSLLHYRLALRQDAQMGVCVHEELLRQFPRSRPGGQGLGFGDNAKPKKLLGKTGKGTDFYAREKGSYQDSFNFGLDKLTLALTPPDDDRYPTANAVRRFLMQGVRYIQLNSQAMRLPCPATRPTELDLDGSNLARVVGKLLGYKPGSLVDTLHGAHPIAGMVAGALIGAVIGGIASKTPDNMPNMNGPFWALPDTPVAHWTEHLRYALPDLDAIGWARRQADNAEYLLLRYSNGLEAPSWILSDGTLRMLALTLPAFLPAVPAIYMVEEPENGVHPKALEIILRSLSSIPGGQMLLATHSPFVVQQCGPEPLLCFSRDEDGAHVLSGRRHPMLQNWDGTPDLGIVFAAGILE